MGELIRIGLDTSKSVFQLHGVDEKEQVILRRKLRRREVLTFFTKLEPTWIGMEACGGVALLGARAAGSSGIGWFWCRRNT